MTGVHGEGVSAPVRAGPAQTVVTTGGDRAEDRASRPGPRRKRAQCTPAAGPIVSRVPVGTRGRPGGGGQGEGDRTGLGSLTKAECERADPSTQQGHRLSAERRARSR